MYSPKQRENLLSRMLYSAGFDPNRHVLKEASRTFRSWETRDLKLALYARDEAGAVLEEISQDLKIPTIHSEKGQTNWIKVVGGTR